MNNNLLYVIKEIVAKYGEAVLCEPRRVNSLFADLAREEPKPQKNALVKCLEHGFVQTLKNVPAQDREVCKQRLAQKLHDEEGLDVGLCGETLDLLEAVLFGEDQKQEEKPRGSFCKNCGKELQEGWKACPYCGTALESQSIGSAISSISSSSGSRGYGVEIIKPETNISSANTVYGTDGCMGCYYFSGDTCNYYGWIISEAVKYDCGMKTSDPNVKKMRRKRNVTIIKWGLVWFIVGFFPIIITGSLIVSYTMMGITAIIMLISILSNKKKRRKNAQLRSR